MSNSSTRTTFWAALRKALLLDAHLYEHVLSTQANRHIALGIVLLASLSHMLGSAVILLIDRVPVPILVLALGLDGLSILVGYYLWTFLVFKIGQRLKPIDPTYKELLSPIGFAYAPQVLNFLTLIPLLGRAIERILAVWSLLAVIVAVRQGLDLRTRSAVLICLVGWIPIQFAVSAVILLFTATPGSHS